MVEDIEVARRQLGTSGLWVSAMGLGCMGMSQSYGPADRDEAIATVRRALDLGVGFLDTSDVYGDGANEELINEALAGRRDEAVIATKVGVIHHPDGSSTSNNRDEYIRAKCDESLRRLGTDRIDLYYIHRLDPTVPIEDTMGTLSLLVDAGKVRYLGLSEVSAATLERACAVHPVAALQSEWSLWFRDIEAEILPTARRLGVGIVPYSPLGKGFLTGAVLSTAMFTQGDSRWRLPRFEQHNLDANRHRIEALQAVVEAKAISLPQLALAWVLAQGADVVPIPGTKRRSYLNEDVAAGAVELSNEDLDLLDDLCPPDGWVGERYGSWYTLAVRDTTPR